MIPSTHGINTSQAEVINIDKFGFWILIEDKEYFLAFRDFPWFRPATIDQILRVETFDEGHLRWPDLDIDLSLNSLSNPEAFPLIYL